MRSCPDFLQDHWTYFCVFWPNDWSVGGTIMACVLSVHKAHAMPVDVHEDVWSILRQSGLQAVFSRHWDGHYSGVYSLFEAMLWNLNYFVLRHLGAEFVDWLPQLLEALGQIMVTPKYWIRISPSLWTHRHGLLGIVFFTFYYCS